MSNTRSLPFWTLVVLSLASAATGIVLALTKIATMESTIQAQTATGVEVYGGQAWIVFGAALAGAGLVGFFAALAVASLRPARVSLADQPTIAEIIATEPVSEKPADEASARVIEDEALVSDDNVVTDAEPAAHPATADEVPARS
ncbi:dinucleotide-utilizing enzyme [uncultured Microbacterium sp.]|uniref:dinucleotide-utilizing enzyme n=1 Tax=uncultured Microbacterium sp. TaxID=191216 RepID=UPI0025DD4879|nr:dinucleotide-utilizing enzyme [uncultured Microbacterium sp.]